MKANKSVEEGELAASSHACKDCKNRNFSCTTVGSWPSKVSVFLSLPILHIKHNGTALQISDLTFFSKKPFQQVNKSVTVLHITQLALNKHKTSDHKSLATSQ